MGIVMSEDIPKRVREAENHITKLLSEVRTLQREVKALRVDMTIVEKETIDLRISDSNQNMYVGYAKAIAALLTTIAVAVIASVFTAKGGGGS